MAVPKGKVSKARKNSRRANWKLSSPGINECPQCRKMKRSHHVCGYCGYYDGKQAIEIEDPTARRA